MPLKLITGPPNSGRAGVVLDEFLQARDNSPVLVVQTRDHVARFERELADRLGALLGGAVMTFEALFLEVAGATGATLPPELRGGARLHAMREATRRTDLPILGRSSLRPGFAAALDSLIEELQGAELDPASVAASAQAAGDPYLEEIARLYAAYAEIRDGLGAGDAHVVAALATDALTREPSAWGNRPVYVYGFDDLTREQLSLLEALGEATEVTVSVTFEDSAALGARATLLAELRDIGATVTRDLAAAEAHTESPLLRHLERKVFEPPPRGRQAPDDGLVLLDSAGARAEAEHVGAEIAALLASGTEPDQVAVVLRDPQRHGRLFARVIESFAIPTAVDARLPFPHTASGRAFLALLRCALLDGDASDYLTFLRLTGRTSPSSADWLEAQIAQGRVHTAGEAAELSGRNDWEIEKLRAARSGRALMDAASEILADFAEYPYGGAARVHAPRERYEIGAVSAARRLIADLGTFDGMRLGPEDLVAALEDQAHWLDDGDFEGRVRIVSPYRVRANRFTHVFVASLQEGEFPRPEPSDPFLSADQRSALGLPGRATEEAEERYLFHVCLSRASKRLYLSFRTLDEDGGELERSQFVDEVISLVEGGEEAVELRRRGLGEVTFAPATAPSEVELARALAARAGNGEDPVEQLAALELDESVRAEVGRRVAAGVEAANRDRPGPLTDPAVLSELGSLELFGASTIEAFLECPYRWFVNHELRPRPLAPRPDPLTQGGVVHAVLERLYREPPGGDPMPRPETLDAWRERATSLLDEEAEKAGVAPRDAATRAGYARMLGLIDAFLDREAVVPEGLRPDPELIEARFGSDEEDQRPPLELDEGVGIHGKIDRIDVGGANGERAGLVRDYKLGGKVAKVADFEKEGKVQLPLYALAAEQLFGLRPLGGLYMPLGATKDPKGRGLLNKEDPDIGLLGSWGTDLLTEEAFRAELRRAVDTTLDAAKRLKRGEIERRPIKGICPRYCTFQAICRRERGVPEELPDEEEVAEA